MASKKRKPKKPRAVRAWAVTYRNGIGEGNGLCWKGPSRALSAMVYEEREAAERYVKRWPMLDLTVRRVRIEVEP